MSERRSQSRLPPADPSGPPDALESIGKEDDEDRVLDVLFDGWTDDYYEGRRLLLGRVEALRRAVDRRRREDIARRIFKTLVSFGESLGEMRLVHLAVECRDALIYPQVRSDQTAANEAR